MRRKPRTPEEKLLNTRLEAFWAEVGAERWSHVVEQAAEVALDLEAHEFNMSPSEAKDSDQAEEILNVAIVRMEEDLENLQKVIEYLHKHPDLL